MLKIRLQRIGRTNEPHFRVVLTDSKNSAKSGKFVEVLGSYNPKQGKVTLEAPIIKEWLKKGAQATATVYNFLVSNNVIEGRKKNVLPKKKPTQKRKEIKGKK